MERAMERRSQDSPVLPTPELTAHAKLLLHQLDDDGARFVLWDRGGTAKPMELSEELFDILRRILIDLSQNRAVQVVPHDTELTTVQAAEFLQVSRPFVIKLIEQGKLPCRLVGTHRRIKFADLVSYQAAMAEQSKTAREEMTRDAERLGWGY